MYTYESVFLSFSPTDVAKYSWGVYFDVAVGALAMIADGALAELNLNQMSEVRERVMEGDREKSERECFSLKLCRLSARRLDQINLHNCANNNLNGNKWAVIIIDGRCLKSLD